MNTNPDDILRGRWLDDELVGEELAVAEAAFGSQEDQVAQLEELRQWKAWFRNGLPTDLEPPSPEIFNARILRMIDTVQSGDDMMEVPPARRGSPIAWFVPMAAAAGMALGFFLGAQKQTKPQIADIDVTGAPKAIPVEPVLYTPEKGVKANWFQSVGADAYVIVLDGVPAIPDEVDFSRSMSSIEKEDEDAAMAGWDVEPRVGGGS